MELASSMDCIASPLALTRQPGGSWHRPASRLFATAADEPVIIRLGEPARQLVLAVLPDSVGRVPHAVLEGDSISTRFLTGSSRLFEATQSWESSDTAGFLSAIAQFEHGLRSIGARMTACYSGSPYGAPERVTMHALGHEQWRLSVVMDTINTISPVRLRIGFVALADSSPVAPDGLTVGCGASSSAELARALAAALAGADSPGRQQARRRYLAKICVGYARMGVPVTSHCDAVREADVDSLDLDDFRRLFPRNALTPPPAPPPIPPSR